MTKKTKAKADIDFENDLWKAANELRGAVAENQYTLNEVQKQDYKLTSGIYVGSEVAEEDDIPFEEKMQGLKKQLIEQFEEGNKLQERIIKNLNKI